MGYREVRINSIRTGRADTPDSLTYCQGHYYDTDKTGKMQTGYIYRETEEVTLYDADIGAVDIVSKRNYVGRKIIYRWIPHPTDDAKQLTAPKESREEREEKDSFGQSVGYELPQAQYPA